MAWRAAASTGVVEVSDGRLRVVWTSAGVAFVEEERLGIKPRIEKRLKMQLIEKPVPAIIKRGLARAARRPGEDDLPIDLTWARDFERDVLLAARDIPWGETRPYSWLARAARRPLAVRAAASIIAREPLWYLIPWHRVVHKGSTVARASTFSKLKQCLLERERGSRSSERTI